MERRAKGGRAVSEGWRSARVVAGLAFVGGGSI